MQNNLRMLQPFRLKRGQNAEISNTNHALPTHSKCTLWYDDMELENPTNVPLKLYKLWKIK